MGQRVRTLGATRTQANNLYFSAILKLNHLMLHSICDFITIWHHNYGSLTLKLECVLFAQVDWGKLYADGCVRVAPGAMCTQFGCVYVAPDRNRGNLYAARDKFIIAF